MTTPVVVKLGGSAAFLPALPVWIEALAGASPPVVIVPGGGPFADTVRAAQEAIGFSDRAAHAMAILAMEQFGRVLLDRDARLVAARMLAEISAAVASGRSCVWLPSMMTDGAPDLPESWEVTSDTLSAWLAGRLGAPALLLIKQAPQIGRAMGATALAAAGIVDPAFPRFLPPATALHLAGPEDAAGAAEKLATGALPGQRLAGAAPARLAG